MTRIRTTATVGVAAITATLAACTTMEPASMDAGMAMEPAGLTSLAPPHAEIIPGQAVRVVGHSDQLALLHNDDPELAANKRLAFDLWRTVLNAGQVEFALDALDPDYIQHNPMVPTGREPFMNFFSQGERLDEVPETIQDELITVLAEDDLVVFAFAREFDDPRAPGETYTTTWFDMFRIDDGVILEHWDPATLPPGLPLVPADEGGPVPVTGTTGLDQIAMLEAADPELMANKRLVFDTWRGLVDARHPAAAMEYLDEGYIQHNPNAATGREGVIAYFSSQPQGEIQDSINWPVVGIVAEGDLVAISFVRELPVPGSETETYTTTWFDMFRIEDNRIAEHWDIATVAAPSGS